ncbi:MAG: hypothetical protein AABY63_09380 [candidate division NC10 bacterium]
MWILLLFSYAAPRTIIHRPPRLPGYRAHEVTKRPAQARVGRQMQVDKRRQQVATLVAFRPRRTRAAITPTAIVVLPTPLVVPPITRRGT